MYCSCNTVESARIAEMNSIPANLQRNKAPFSFHYNLLLARGLLMASLYCSTSYVIGIWKTDRNVTLGLFHFIGPANGYIHTLHIHTAIIRLG